MKRGKVIDTIKDFIAQGELSQAIEYGIQFLGNKDFILFASRFNRLEKSFQSGLITFEQYEVRLNRLSKGILDLIYAKPEELQPKKRNRLILFLVFTGFFTDWRKAALVVRSLLFALVGIISIIVGVSLWSAPPPLVVVNDVNTNGFAPTINLTATSNITQTSAMLNGVINPNEQDTYAWFRTTSADSLQFQYIGRKKEPVNLMPYNLKNLAPGSDYEFQLVSSNQSGIIVGDWTRFATLKTNNHKINKTSPSLKLVAPSVASLGATLNLKSVSYGSDLHCWFEDSASNILFRDRFLLNGEDSVQGVLTYYWTGLIPNTSYKFRAVTKNKFGTTFGSWQSFTTDK